MCKEQHHRAQPVDHPLDAHLLAFFGSKRGQIGHRGRAPDTGKAADEA